MNILDTVRSVYERRSDLVNAVYRNLSFGIVTFVASAFGLSMLLDYRMLYNISWVAGLSSIAMAWWLQSNINEISSQTATLLFYAYAALIGSACSSIFLVYSLETIGIAVGMTSVLFMIALYIGRNLEIKATDVKFLALGAIVLFIEAIGSMILRLFGVYFYITPLELIMSVLGMVVMTGLSAYEISIFEQSNALVRADTEKAASILALRLLIRVINIFLYALRFLRATSGNSRR